MAYDYYTLLISLLTVYKLYISSYNILAAACVLTKLF